MAMQSQGVDLEEGMPLAKKEKMSLLKQNK